MENTPRNVRASYLTRGVGAIALGASGVLMAVVPWAGFVGSLVLGSAGVLLSIRPVLQKELTTRLNSLNVAGLILSAAAVGVGLVFLADTLI